MFTPVKRIGTQRLFSSGAVSALKSEKFQTGVQAESDDPGGSSPGAADVKGPILSRDSVWRNDGAAVYGAPFSGVTSPRYYSAAQPGLPTHLQLIQAAAQSSAATATINTTTQALLEEPLRGYRNWSTAVTAPPTPTAVQQELYDEQPALDMEAFLQELALSDASSSQADLSYFDPAEVTSAQLGGEYGSGSPLSTAANLAAFSAAYDPLLTLAVVDPAKAVHQFNAMPFEALCTAIGAHIWNTGPVPDVALFYLFRKVHTKEQSDQAVTALVTDREIRTSQGISTPYSEVTSAAVFNALNRTGGETLVVAAAEKAFELGLTLSRSNMYHLMKQYSVQGKVDHVEKLFRALQTSGKSWNSNCIVIMMLAYFNQGRFEEADTLRHELNARGIKISERIETRLDKLLTGEEKWRWEDKVFYRPKRTHLAPPPGFAPVPGAIRSPRVQSLGRAYVQLQSIQGLHQAAIPAYQEPEQQYILKDLPPVTLKVAVKEPRIHLNVLRSAGFDDLYSVLVDFVREEGPVENVCISFLFRKVETKRDVERAMAFLREERAARTNAGISEEYNETTCSRIFTALFRTGASDLAFSCAENAHETGLVLSGKALHELLKSYATRNDVEKVEEIWKLVKLNGKPSSRIVYSIFRTYFDNGMMQRASAFHKEIQSIGIKLSASATRNIEDVLSGVKSWVRDPRSDEF